MSSVIGSKDVWDVTPCTPLFFISSSAALIASSLTVDALNMSSTSYVAECNRRFFPDEAAVATQAPSPALMPAFENASVHAAFSSAADILALSLCTLTPAIAASARSFTFAFNLASEKSARMESRVVSAASFLAWAAGGGGTDAAGVGSGTDGDGADVQAQSGAQRLSMTHWFVP